MSRLIQMQARFQQKQMQEKEEKLLKLYENQQQRAFEKVNRGSAGSNESITTTIQPGKVRQMFDERRQKAGIDKSYPLEPLKTTRSNGISKLTTNNNNRNGRSVIKTTTQKSFTQLKNGKPIVGKRQVVQSIYKNNYGDETYEEKTYEDSNGNDSYYNNTPEHNLISLMNDTNLDDSLQNEEMPSLIYDETDEISNYSHKLEKKNSSQNLIAKKPEVKTFNKTNVIKKPSSPVKREIKPTVKKSVVRTNITSSAGSTPQPGISAKLSYNYSNSADSMSNRAPSSYRPSAKQTAKGSQSAVVRDDLVECKYCNRRFAEDRLRVHQEICAKTGKKKRKTYDALRHRVQGTELEPFVKKGKGPSSVPAKQTNHTETKQQNQQQGKGAVQKKDWRRQHEEFISSIRAAKMAQAHVAKGGKLSDLPPPPASTNPDYIQCPHCGRRFNEAAAERHIPKCATFEFNKPKQQSTRGTRSFTK